jgi:hypothetical protein
MAKVSGGAAYQRLDVPVDGVSQALQFWGAKEADKVAAKKLADEREGVRKKEEVKAWEEKYNLKESDFQNKYTGFKSFDDMNTDFSIHMTDEYVNLQRAAKEALEKGDLATKTKLEGEMVSLKNLFGEASKSQEFFGEKFKSYQKAVQEGKVSGSSKDFEDIVQEAILNKNIALRRVDGNLVYTGLKDDGNGGKEPFTIPYQDLMDGSFSWYEKQQISGEGGVADNLLNNLGTISKESENGYYKITSQAWDDKVHGVATDDAIDAMLGSDEVMGDLLYQFSQGKSSKMFNFSEEDYKLVKDKLKGIVRAGYSEKFGSDFNSSKYSTDTQAALAKQKTKSKEDEDLGVRAWNIDQVRDNNDVSFFSAGDFEWNGVNYEATGARMVGDKLVISTREGEKITVPKNNETALNELFNAFEGKVLTFDKVQTVDKLAWRESRRGQVSQITDALDKQYSPDGKFIGEETPFVSELTSMFPDADIKEAVAFQNAIKVNGTTIKLDNKSKQQVEKELVKALGINPLQAQNPSGKEKIDW